MTEMALLVLFCEGNNTETSLDLSLYSLLFDQNKTEIRAAQGGHEMVREKTIATCEAQEMLRSSRLYFGLCDRDRNLGIKFPDVMILPVAEVENLFWLPDLLRLFDKILEELGENLLQGQFQKNKKEFWSKFRLLTGKRIFYYMTEYQKCRIF